MSYFPNGSIEDEMLADAQYFQRTRNATDREIIKALAEVLKYYAERMGEK